MGGIFESYWTATAHQLDDCLTRCVELHQATLEKKGDTSSLLSSWNIRTMCSGLSGDLQQLGDARKTAVIIKELDRLNIDNTCLQETRLADIRETNYTFWQGNT